MKRFILWVILSLLLASPSYGAIFNGTGTVYLLRSHDTALGANVDFFLLVGVSSLGACKTADAGYVVLRLRDDAKGQRMFTVVLSAKASGTPVTAWVDDTVTDSAGFCYAIAVE